MMKTNILECTRLYTRFYLVKDCEVLIMNSIIEGLNLGCDTPKLFEAKGFFGACQHYNSSYNQLNGQKHNHSIVASLMTNG